MPPSVQQPRHLVTAVIVAHDGARLLPGLVGALRSQTYPIQRAVGVDTGSTDRSGTVLAELIGAQSVFGMDRSCGYPAAVAAALANPAARSVGSSGVEWIWLLHDDCEPEPDALERLLRAAVKDRAIAVVGPKIRDLNDRRVLREAGVSIDRAGRRITGIEPGEIDQGQHDGNRGVFAVGSAGMLVRRDVWDKVGGFDSYLTLFRDDVDFCWRVHAAGYRVQIVTDAVLYHRELGFRRVRDEGGPHPRRLDRRNALYVLAANLPVLAMLWTVVGFAAGSLLRAAWFVLTKQSGKATDQVAAIAGVLAHPVALWKARRRRRRTRRAGYAAIRGFIPASRTLNRLAESVAGLVSSGPPTQSGGHHASEDPDEEQFTDEQSLLRRIIAHPAVLLLAALILVTAVSERRVIGAGLLAGGALVPAWNGASGLWHTYLSQFHPTGIGSSAIAPPYLAVVAMLGWLMLGKASFAVDVLLLGCVPLAGATAYLASRRVVESSTARTIGAAAYALLPVAMGAVAAGRLGTAVVVALLPLIGMAAARLITRAAQPRIARRAAWATGLLVGVAAAFAPLLWIVAALLAAAVAGWSYLAPRRGWQPVGVISPPALLSPVNGAIVALTPALVLFPWSLSLLLHPGGFLLEAGIARPGLSSAGLNASSMLLLHPGGPGLPPAWMSIGLCLAVLGLLVPSRRRAVSYAGWIVAVTGLVAGIFISRMTIPASGSSVAAWPGPEIAIASAGLILASLPLIEWLVQLAASTTWRGRRAGAIGALAVLASTPVFAAGYWLVSGVRGPVAGVTSNVLPAFVSVASGGPQEPRTLVLRSSGGGVTYSVIRSSDPALGEPELAAPASAANSLGRTVAALVSVGGEGAGDPGGMLSGYGIKWIMLPGPINAALAQRLDADAGLTLVSTSASYDLWQVAGVVARARVVEPGGTVVPLPSDGTSVHNVAAPSTGGTLLLAEPATGWTATLDGHELSPSVVGGWEQAFTIPAGGGTLSVYADQTWRGLGLVLEAMALLAVIVLALPGRRAEEAALVVARVPGREPVAADPADTSAWAAVPATKEPAAPPETATAATDPGSRVSARAVSARGRAAASRARAVSRPRLPGLRRRGAGALRVRRGTDEPEPEAPVSAPDLSGLGVPDLSAQRADPFAPAPDSFAPDEFDDPFASYVPLTDPFAGATRHHDSGTGPFAASQETGAPQLTQALPATTEPPAPAVTPPPPAPTPRSGRGRRAARHSKRGRERDS